MMGLNSEPLFSYEYPIAIDSMNIAGQWSIGCISAKISEVNIIAIHGELSHALAIDCMSPLKRNSSKIGTTTSVNESIKILIMSWGF